MAENNRQLLKALFLNEIAKLSGELSSPVDLPQGEDRQPIRNMLRGLAEELTSPTGLTPKPKRQKRNHPFFSGLSAGKNESLNGLGHAISSKMGKTIMDIFEGK